MFLTPLVIYGLGVLAALIDRSRSTFSHLFALLGSLAGLVIAFRSLTSSALQPSIALPIAPFAQISLRIDPLASYFLLIISLIGVATSLYAVGYLKGEHCSLAAMGAGYNGFLAAMMLVVLANSVFAFLFAWELMSLISFFLVIAHHRDESVRSAGYVYLVMTHAGTAFLVIAFLLLFVATGSFDFQAVHAAASQLSPFTRDLIFLLALVAFSTKAGVIPLHVWLPRAHPAAPSHVSALMSGVMIKTAIYGLLRVGWDLIGPGPAWWGALLLVLGVVSAVLGVLYALMEHDLKRLLAYHSVENIGIILIGLGTAFLLAPLGPSPIVALALLAALYHVLNHAVFKALLFLGAGAVQQATRTRDLEALGGLIRRMPWTAAGFLIGAAAISALPPLNGFVSEWLTFQSLLSLAIAAPLAPVKVGAAVAAALLALTSGLAAFCFVKAFAIGFLGMPRSHAAKSAVEVRPSMIVGMLVLALLCFALGLFPPVVIRLLDPVTQQLTGSLAQPSLSLALPPAPSASGSLASFWLFGLLIVLAGFTLTLVRIIGGPGRSRVAPPWGCGIVLEPSMQYSATALAKPVRIIFRALIRPYREIERRTVDNGSYFVSSVHYEAGIRPIYERYFYSPLVHGMLVVAQQIRALQNGSLRTYLAYICVTLVALLLLAR